MVPQHNDELWDVLQPALWLASKVLLSEHPFWKAILSVYHLRPVPVEKDGRTQQQKAEATYRPYISLWYEVDRDKMFPRARALMDQNFDSTAATLELLNRCISESLYVYLSLTKRFLTSYTNSVKDLDYTERRGRLCFD